jgi:CubicO group peptidase (beta-lactamase class C family)
MVRFHGGWICTGMVIGSLALTGCGPSAETGGGDMNALANQLEQSKQAAVAAKAAEEARAAKEKAAQEAAAAAAERQAQAEAERQAAAAAAPQGGTTAGAATVGQGGSYVDAIIGARRHILTATDNLAWTQALQHHKATTGEMPKNNEEFMKIMAEGGIPLPELEQGQEHFWDPSEGDWGTLYIVEPAPPGSPITPPPAQ